METNDIETVLLLAEKSQLRVTANGVSAGKTQLISVGNNAYNIYGDESYVELSTEGIVKLEITKQSAFNYKINIKYKNDDIEIIFEKS